jgi:hypothetical protein
MFIALIKDRAPFFSSLASITYNVSSNNYQLINLDSSRAAPKTLPLTVNHSKNRFYMVKCQ